MTQQKSKTQPLNFALVLGSGGVRSIAALGMVEVLAREGLMPDLLVGCSAGAMFGALVAAGHNADEAVRIATRLWSADITRQRRWRLGERAWRWQYKRWCSPWRTWKTSSRAGPVLW